MTVTVDARGDVTTGVLGGSWRAEVTSWGTVAPWDDTPLHWWVAADDRWHTPADEPTVRQARLEGTPVVETRLRIPGGDAVQQVFSVPDAGGLTLIEVRNDSPLPIAVAYGHGELLSSRPPADVPIDGIAVPAGAVVFPIGHHASLAVALTHDRPRRGRLPSGLPDAAQVVRGWVATAERAGRLVVPDRALVAGVVATRCELALRGPGDPTEGPVAFLLAGDQLERMGVRSDWPSGSWLAEVAAAVEATVRPLRRRRTTHVDSASDIRPDALRASPWAIGAAVSAAERVCHRAGDPLAIRDLAALRTRFADRLAGELPTEQPGGAEGVAWAEHRLADPDGRLLADGLPDGWLGAAVEAHGLPVGRSATVSFALRWHGARPAVLWDVIGDHGTASEPVTLTAPVLAPGWSTATARGEALWPAPSS